ncbi:MAG: hypothetical protein R3F11_05175 [Verrucomicrobiales bacterium]
MNSWVDVRSTENLWLMRTTSVYLMAEETGNEETRKLYRQHLLDYAKTLYRIGIGEWDSENYHGHSTGPLLNLYDFAKDRDVRAAAKACLDFYAVAGAVKYWRGGFNGPTKRDYNHAQPFGGSAANSLWMWFGDHPTGKEGGWESDEVHQITSAYRPPLAAVHLAHKKFPRPVELFAAKPPYDATTGLRGDSRPEYFETQYVAHSYQMGSLTGGTSVDGGDVNGFKILAFDQKQGAVALHAVPGSNPAFPGSPMYQNGIVSAPNRVAQQENLALWLVKDGASPWLWVVPDEVKVTRKGAVTFLEADRTWVAIRSLGASPLQIDGALTKQLQEDKKSRFPGHQVLSARGEGGAFCGLAVEVGERNRTARSRNSPPPRSPPRSMPPSWRKRGALQIERRQVARHPLERRPAGPRRLAERHAARSVESGALRQPGRQGRVGERQVGGRHPRRAFPMRGRWRWDRAIRLSAVASRRVGTPRCGVRPMHGPRVLPPTGTGGRTQSPGGEASAWISVHQRSSASISGFELCESRAAPRQTSCGLQAKRGSSKLIARASRVGGLETAHGR